MKMRLPSADKHHQDAKPHNPAQSYAWLMIGLAIASLATWTVWLSFVA